MRKIFIISGIIFIYLVVSGISVLTASNSSQVLDAKRTILEAKRLYPEISEINTSLILSIIEVESKFKSTAIGSVGEVGLMQVRPSTYDWIMNEYGIKHNSDIADDLNNIVAGMHYLKWLMDRLDNRTFKVIQAYNVGLNGMRKGRYAIIYAVKVYYGSFKYILV